MVLELPIRCLRKEFGALLEVACTGTELSHVEKNTRVITARAIVFFIPTSYLIEYTGYLSFLANLASCSQLVLIFCVTSKPAILVCLCLYLCDHLGFAMSCFLSVVNVYFVD
jgi:hypothetical protein